MQAKALCSPCLHWVQLDDLSALQQAEQAELAATVCQLGADKAALQGRLEQAEAEAASLRRMVRMLKYGDSAAPSPMAGAAASLPAVAAGGGASTVRRWQRPDRSAAAGEVPTFAGGVSDSGSSCEAEEQPPHAAAPAAQANSSASSSSGGDGEASGGSASSGPAPQQRRRRDASRRSGGRTNGSDTRARFLEEQVQSLTAALRRLQRQNRDLSAQLAETGPPAADGSSRGAPVPMPAGSLHPREAAGALALRHELSGLASENAALRRQLGEAEAEAGRAQRRMQQQQAEARSLHAQVVEVSERCRLAGSLLGLLPPLSGLLQSYWQTLLLASWPLRPSPHRLPLTTAPAACR